MMPCIVLKHKRGIENFPISNIYNLIEIFFINAVVLIKRSASIVNEKLGILDSNKKNAIVDACDKILQDELNSQFPIDIFQTGSGTSTNMNVNEVISKIASNNSKIKIHPNDDVNLEQSSNDTIPTAINISLCLKIRII